MSKIDKQKANALKKTLSKAYEDLLNYEGDQFIVTYHHKDEFIGYHASSGNQLTDDRNVAKRYMGDNPEDQLRIINNNLKIILNTSESDLENADSLKQFFIKLRLTVKENYFKDMDINDIFLNYEYLNGSEPKLKVQIKDVNDFKDE